MIGWGVGQGCEAAKLSEAACFRVSAPIILGLQTTKLHHISLQPCQRGLGRKRKRDTSKNSGLLSYNSLVQIVSEVHLRPKSRRKPKLSHSLLDLHQHPDFGFFIRSQQPASRCRSLGKRNPPSSGSLRLRRLFSLNSNRRAYSARVNSKHPHSEVRSWRPHSKCQHFLSLKPNYQARYGSLEKRLHVRLGYHAEKRFGC